MPSVILLNVVALIFFQLLQNKKRIDKDFLQNFLEWSSRIFASSLITDGTTEKVYKFCTVAS
jgi:hypothetical protein